MIIELTKEVEEALTAMLGTPLEEKIQGYLANIVSLHEDAVANDKFRQMSLDDKKKATKK